MKLIESKAEVLEQKSGLEGIYQMIELAGRTCYKSEDKITYDSSVDFVNRMISSGHTAMLEHGTVYLRGKNAIWPQIPAIAFERNPYSKTHYVKDEIFVTTNYRVMVENNLLGCMEFICEPTEFHERRISLKFTTSIGITRELIRHRVFSFANESTRYCNYTRNKFGNELTFIIPSWTELPEGTYTRPEQDNGFWSDWLCNDEELFSPSGQRHSIEFGTDRFLMSLWMAEGIYTNMVSGDETMKAHSPQEIREILPLCTKSDIVMTGFVSDWKHFFDLRLLGTTGKPHPDMLLLAEKAKKALEEKDLWGLIYKPN